MKDLKLILLCLFVALGMASCDVHEFPDTSGVPDVPVKPKSVLKVVFDSDEFDYLQTVDLATRASGDFGHEFRLIVRLYPVKSDSRGRTISRSPIKYYTETLPIGTPDSDVTIPLDVPAGEYQVVAWADYVKSGTIEDLYYTTDDFIEVRLPGAGESGYVHNGNNAYREAWRGSTDIIVADDGSLIRTAESDSELNVATVYMERPLARYHFVTTDLKQFLESEAKRAGETGGTPSPAPDKLPSLDNYRIIVRYTGYMNCSLNVISDKPVDSATGVFYDGKVKMIDEDRAEIAFDHLFVNHAQTSVQVALDLYRRSDGTLLSSTGVVNVPLKRGHYTLIQGPLLTTMAGAGTGINPDFFDDFNIEIK